MSVGRYIGVGNEFIVSKQLTYSITHLNQKKTLTRFSFSADFLSADIRKVHRDGNSFCRSSRGSSRRSSRRSFRKSPCRSISDWVSGCSVGKEDQEPLSTSSKIQSRIIMNHQQSIKGLKEDNFSKYKRKQEVEKSILIMAREGLKEDRMNYVEALKIITERMEVAEKESKRMRDEVDTLKSEVKVKEAEISFIQTELLHLKMQFEEERAESRKTKTLEVLIDLYELEHVDTDLLDHLRMIEVGQYSERQQKHLLLHLQRITLIFNYRYKETLLKKVRLKVTLSVEEAGKVNCLTLAVSLLSQININDNLSPLVDSLLGYLRVINEGLIPNMVAARMTQIFLTSICNACDRCHIRFNEEGREILSRIFITYKGNDHVMIPSSYLLVVVLNRRKVVVEEEIVLEAVTYLRAIMETSTSTNIHGFCLGPRQRAEVNSTFMKILETSIDLYEAGWEDTELLDRLRSIEVSRYSERQQKHLVPHLQRIIRIFNVKYKETLFGKVRDKVTLSGEEAGKVNCLTLAVSLLSLINIYSNLLSLIGVLLGYLTDLNERIPTNMVTARMTQIFLTSICNASDRRYIKFNEEKIETLLRTFITYRGNDPVRIPSGYLLVVIFNRMNEVVVEEEVFLEAVTYLREIMKTSTSTNSHGFCLGPRQKREVDAASSKISN